MRAGFCSECRSKVYLDDNGTCANGHTTAAVSGIHEVAAVSGDIAISAPDVTPLAPGDMKPRIHERRWFLPALFFIGGVVAGVVIASPSIGVPGTSGGALRSENESLQRQVAKLARERDTLRAELEPIRRAGQTAAKVASDPAALAAGKASPAPRGSSPSTGSKRRALPENTFGPGVHLVGKDIPAGEYIGAPVEGGYPEPYWKVSSLANGGDIIENGTPDGQFYIQVKKGQYLTLDSVVITLVE